jgi:hypothetical protein
MAIGWFQKATGVFSRREDPPQPFSLTCDCGVQLAGMRQAAPQKPSCPACGSTHFILPACVYPVPTTLRRDWFGEEIEPKKPAAKPSSNSTPQTTTATPATPRAKDRAKPAATPARPPSPTPAERVQQAQRQLRTFFTPVRMVVLAMVVIVGLTGLMLLRSSRREWARSHVEPAVDRGLQAFRERDFSTASAAFDDAVQALDYLGRRDAAALAIRQYQRESDAAVQLSGSGIADILKALSEGKQRSNTAERFQTDVAGKWLMFDAVLELQRPAENAGKLCVVDVPLALNDQPLDLAFDDVPWPQLWKAAPGDGPRRVVFAAQWERFDPPGGQNRPATLVLRSSTAVLWCHFDTYQLVSRAALSDDDQAALRELLQSQRQALGVGDAR